MDSMSGREKGLKRKIDEDKVPKKSIYYSSIVEQPLHNHSAVCGHGISALGHLSSQHGKREVVSEQLLVEIWTCNLFRRLLEHTEVCLDSDIVAISTVGAPVWSEEWFQENALELIEKPKDFATDGTNQEAQLLQQSLDDDGSIDRCIEGSGEVELEACNSKAAPTQLRVLSRERKQTISRMTASQMSFELSKSDIDPHLLVAPQRYGESFGAGAHESQPFDIKVHPQVGFLTDIHGHLCEAEVIGLLAGKWDAINRVLYIQAPFPCASTERTEDNGATDVELDPVAELQVREEIHAMDMLVVGWYHSHPRFKPDPSVTDIRNQQQYQHLMRDEQTGISPFVGLIVSTYDTNLRTSSAFHQWFHVKPFANGRKSTTVFIPMLLEVQVMSYTQAKKPSQWTPQCGLQELLSQISDGWFEKIVKSNIKSGTWGLITHKFNFTRRTSLSASRVSREPYHDGSFRKKSTRKRKITQELCASHSPNIIASEQNGRPHGMVRSESVVRDDEVVETENSSDFRPSTLPNLFALPSPPATKLNTSRESENNSSQSNDSLKDHSDLGQIHFRAAGGEEHMVVDNSFTEMPDARCSAIQYNCQELESRKILIPQYSTHTHLDSTIPSVIDLTAAETNIPPPKKSKKLLQVPISLTDAKPLGKNLYQVGDKLVGPKGGVAGFKRGPYKKKDKLSERGASTASEELTPQLAINVDTFPAELVSPISNLPDFVPKPTARPSTLTLKSADKSVTKMIMKSAAKQGDSDQISNKTAKANAIRETARHVKPSVQQITLIQLLKAPGDSSIIARRLLMSAPLSLRCLLLGTFTLGWYYAHNSTRVELFDPGVQGKHRWKGLLKGEKMIASVRAGWARIAGVDAVLEDLAAFFAACWLEGGVIQQGATS